MIKKPRVGSDSGANFENVTVNERLKLTRPIGFPVANLCKQPQFIANILKFSRCDKCP